MIHLLSILSGAIAETRTGAFFYYGDAASSHGWEFRTRLRIACKTRDQDIEAMSKVCDGLRGDAFVAAQEVCFDNLCEIVDGRPCGIDTLIQHMRGMVFPVTEHESKELFRLFCRRGGPLSRQNGESMKRYVSRRRRCRTLLVQMDPVIHLSEGHRSDMFVDLSGLTREERVMVQASISNERGSDRVAEALIIQDPHMHLRESQRRAKGKGKDGFKRVDNPNTREFCGNGKGKHIGSGKSGASAHHANLTSVEDYDYHYDEDMDESANAYQAHTDPVFPGSDDGEEAPDHDDDEDNDRFSSYVALNDVTVFEAAELDAITLLADTWNDDLDPEVSAQLVQASAQAYFSCGRRKGKEKVKAKAKARADICRWRTVDDGWKNLKAKAECGACGRKGHWANDRECAMSPSSSSTQNQTRTARIATRQHLTNQANQAGACFVLIEYSDDPETSAYMVGQNVPLPKEATEQIPLTPTASAAVDIKNTATLNGRVVDDNDEPRATEADGRQRRTTGDRSRSQDRMEQNVQERSVSWYGYGVVLRDFPKQVVSLTKAKSVPTNMRDFLSWAQRQHRIDVTASTVERKTGGLASAGT